MTSEIRNPKSEIKISVIGLGHVGLPTALGLADLGWQVTGADDDRDKATRIAHGEAPFYEPGLQDLLRKHLSCTDVSNRGRKIRNPNSEILNGLSSTARFRVADTVEEAVRESTVVFVCVGTPQRDDGSADLSQIEAVARAIARSLNGKKLIVEKSTSPVRTAERIRQTIERYRNGDHAFEVAVNPEFLREGSAIYDFFHPDRIVLGVESPWGRDLLLQVYGPLLERLRHGEAEPREVGDPVEDRVIVTTLATAELIKHAANAFLATKISFINMIADLCEAVGADVTEVARGLGLDPRIGPHFLRAGIGYGGYCLPKDLRAFIHIAGERGVDFSLLKEVERINERRIDRFLHKVRQALWVVQGKIIGILGLAFKPGTDDIREAPSLKIIDRLLKEGASLRVHDPQAMDNVRQAFPEEEGRLMFCSSPYEVAQGAHALLLLTEWEEYRTLDLPRIRELVEVPILIDGRNALDPAACRRAGFEYHGIGR